MKKAWLVLEIQPPLEFSNDKEISHISGHGGLSIGYIYTIVSLSDTMTKKKQPQVLEDKWTHVLLFGKLLINVAQIEHTNDAGHSHRIELPCATAIIAFAVCRNFEKVRLREFENKVPFNENEWFNCFESSWELSN